ncbi:hypothetical protein HYC85_011031 [Camellia sinensis]|uniref:Uncharacterized protein n=1 Tax=Camellia sinensis TaxID=4442 RepID=A0A7J7HL03_CAMSI|nr:hypothetical protein HYC85_011031 [Camellia sinensis]
MALNAEEEVEEGHCGMDSSSMTSPKFLGSCHHPPLTAARHQHHDRLLEHLDTTTPFSGFGIKKMGESSMQCAHLQMDDKQSKTALEEGKLGDAVSCRAKEDLRSMGWIVQNQKSLRLILSIPESKIPPVT